MFDAACLLWQDTCGVRGSCFFYDKQLLAYLVFGVCVGYKVLALVFMVCAWRLYVPPKADVIEKDVGGDGGGSGNGWAVESFEMSDKKATLGRVDSTTSFTSISDLNKAFDREVSTVDKNSAIVNGTLTYVASTDNLIDDAEKEDNSAPSIKHKAGSKPHKSAATAVPPHLNDVTVNEFFLASGAQSSPLISGRLLTTSL